VPDGSAPQAGAHNPLAVPAVVLGVRGPWLIGAARLSAHIQTRLRHACKRTAELCGSPGKGRLHVLAANNAEPWARPDLGDARGILKAIEDYSRDYLLIGRLAAGVTNKAVTAAHCATKDANEPMLPPLAA
jgi:hypothetical protein